MKTMGLINMFAGESTLSKMIMVYLSVYIYILRLQKQKLNGSC